MAIGDIFQATLVGELFGQTTNMTMHYRQTAGSNLGPPAVGLADKVDTTYAQDILAVQTTEYSHLGVQCAKISPSPRELTWFVANAPGQGALPPGALPPSVCPTITKQTALAGVKERGRIYIPGVARSLTDAGEMTPAGLIALQTATLQLVAPLTDLNGNTFQPIIWHRASSTYTDIVFRQARQVLRNQRRRQIGVGK